ncbi:hypothetical protein MCUN1_002206 [Malassezia cuniculi]|uniref:Sec39 domain-containing protein n=1 Tax=Malassezia cuniculi TaxID=948313 RepID=A0AAF0J6A7_9BASI|nr:hypothetical protein MCUN1_002206 [Malassezia cuniculi]
MTTAGLETRRAFLRAPPAACEAALETITGADDDWWAGAAAVTAVKAAPHWKASDAAALLAAAAARTASFDDEVYRVFARAKKEGAPVLHEWLADDADRLAHLLLRRQLWQLQWLLCIPLAASKTAEAGDVSSVADAPVLFHAHSLALAGNARALRALLGAHPAVARALFPYRFRLLHLLLTVGGKHADHLSELRLLPGTHMPVQDRESGAWIDSLDASPAARASLWVEHPLVIGVLAEKGVAAPPEPAPEPPSALVQWYSDRVTELGGELGLVDNALGLARAAVSIGLTPLRAAANELGFVAQLGGTWRVASLRNATFAEIVTALAAHATLSELREAMPFFRTGSFADADYIRMLSDDDLAVRMLLVLVEQRTPQALALAEQAVAESWISRDARAALALAVVLGWHGSDSASYKALRGMLDALSITVGRDAPLMVLLRETLRARDASVGQLWTLIAQVEPADVFAALGDAAAFVALGESIHKWVPRPPRELVASDELSVRLGATLGDAAINDANAREAICAMFAALEPHLGGGLVDASTFEAVLITLLRAQRYPLFHMVVADLKNSGSAGFAAALPQGPEALVISEARKAFDAAKTCDATTGPLRRARQSLAAAPQTAAIAQELAVVDTVALLGAYDLVARDGKALRPTDVRATEDPLDLLARLLAVHGSAYRQADEMMELAHALVKLPNARQPDDVQISVLALLVDAAMAADDLACAKAYCERMASVAADASRRRPGGASDGNGNGNGDGAWRACFQLGKHPEWRDAKSRADVLGQALVLAPPENIPRILSEWATLDGASLVPARALPPRDTISRLLSTQWTSRRQEPLGKAASLFDSFAPSHAEQAARMARSLWDGLGDDARITGSLRGAVGWLMGGDER